MSNCERTLWEKLFPKESGFLTIFLKLRLPTLGIKSTKNKFLRGEVLGRHF